jgi:hypothetical protein
MLLLQCHGREKYKLILIGGSSLTQPKMQRRSKYKEKIEIDHEWVETIGKTAFELSSNHRKNQEHNRNFITKSSDPILLGCIGLAIEQHLDALPPNLRPPFQQMLDDVKSRKEDLERS